ncbi:u-box domain-containing protein [Cystoisospora suis]|uniref:RING-type E3 ubiquitin transferase n=1 Tax=Cystoisospora suis TaxID=483139 RepID=A0A2C6L0A5_9APIC|nr:u-box domain-containing protein [Cystoisospora suis]
MTDTNFSHSPGVGEDGGEGGGGSEISPAKEDHFLQLVLRVTVDSKMGAGTGAASHLQLHYLKSYAEELLREGKRLRLARSELETILIKRVQDAARDGDPNLFKFFSDSFHRANDEVYSKGLPASQRASAVQAVQRELVNYAVLLLSCPELFELGDPPPYKMLETQLTQFLEMGCPQSFFSRLIDGVLSQEGTDGGGEQCLSRWFGPVVSNLCDHLNLHSMTEYKSPAFNALKFLSSQKPTARLLAESQLLLPTFHRRFPATKPGFFYQENSLLGRLLSASLLDGPTLKKGEESLAMKYFASNHALTIQHLQTTVQTLRHDEQSLEDAFVQIVKNLCRGGYACRQRVLRWFAEVLSSNELRAKMGHVLRITQQQAAESLDPMHSMLLKVQGQTTYGFALNTFWAILGLVEPIRIDKLNDICYFYAMRSDQVSNQILGDLKKDAKLGNDASVAAIKPFCDLSNQAPLTSESKFPTEVFWLALKALRVLFNPCMGEFTRILHKFQTLHDEGISPVSPEYRFLVAEIMAWRTVVLHPRFCALYWHFLHLALSWLLRAVYCFNLDGSPNTQQESILAKQQNRFSTLVLHTCPPPLQQESQRKTRGSTSSLSSPSHRNSNRQGGERETSSPSSGAEATNPMTSPSSSSPSGSSSASSSSSPSSRNETKKTSSAQSEPVTVPPQFAALPSAFVEDIFTSIRRMLELQSVYLSVRSTQGFEQPPVACMDVELVASACIAVMMASDFFRNVHMRCDGACKTLYFMVVTEGLRGRLEDVPVVQDHLVRALTEVFIASERGSYYDRITFRIPIVDLFQKLLVIDEFKQALHTLGSTNPEKFINMIHLLLNDVSALVDQAMSALTEIRKRQLEGRDHDEEPSTNQQNAGGRTGSSGEGGEGAGAGGSGETAGGRGEDRRETSNESRADSSEEDEDDDDDTGASLEGNSQLRRETWSRLESTTRDLCSLGFNACSLFALYAKECGSVGVCLPLCIVMHACRRVYNKELKYSTSGSDDSRLLFRSSSRTPLSSTEGMCNIQCAVNNMEKYNFKPKNWLMKVLESYVYLLQADPEDGALLVGEILKDGRYFQKDTVNKAYRIAKREGLMNAKLLEKFQELVKMLAEGKDEEVEIDYDDFPAEYLDPIMADVMTDPVRLPTSNNVMDRKHIERHLMSEPSDPFNRMPLTKEELIPLPELRAEIAAFIASKKGK